MGLILLMHISVHHFSIVPIVDARGALCVPLQCSRMRIPS